MENLSLHELLERVSDRDSFLEFVRALMADRVEAARLEREQPGNPWAPGPGGWESSTIEGYLEAALSWAEATDFGHLQGLPEVPSWKGFAVFLYLGKIYE